MLHLNTEAEAIFRFQFEGTVEVVALPRQGRWIVHPSAIGIIFAVGVQLPAVFQLEATHLQGGRRAPEAVQAEAVEGREHRVIALCIDGIRLGTEEETVILAGVGHFQFETAETGAFRLVREVHVQQESPVVLDRGGGNCFCGGGQDKCVCIHFTLGTKHGGACQE